jgi:hypothetical protein
LNLDVQFFEPTEETNMKKVSEVLEQGHQHGSEFHHTMAKAHADAAAGEEKGTSRLAFHKAAAAAHAKYAAGHDALVEECQKAVSATDLGKANRVVPSQVHGAIPSVPRMVARPGQPAPGSVTKVDIEAERILPDTEDERFYI